MGTSEINIALQAHAQTCPFYYHPKGSGEICLSHNDTDRPCDRGCEYCRRFLERINAEAV